MKKNKAISRYCTECDGTGYLSSCCGSPMHESLNQCEYCGKFASPQFCCGDGEVPFRVGDSVYYMVTHINKDSSELNNKLWRKKDNKRGMPGFTRYASINGIVREIIDKETVMVKFEGIREKHKINIYQLENNDL